jgi:hypothetical protein
MVRLRVQPRRKGGRGRRRTGGLNSEGVPTGHVTSRGPCRPRVRVVCFVLCHFRRHVLMVTTAIGLVHLEISQLGK